MECPDRAVSVTSVVVVYLLVSLGLYVVLAKEGTGVVSSDAEVREVVLKIFATYASTMGSVGDLKARGPAFLRTMVGWARPVSGGLSLGFYPIKCALGLDFYSQTWGTVALPALFVCTYCVAEFCTTCSRTGLARSMMTCTVIVLFYMYPPIVQTLLSCKLIAFHS
jgi:hypothetical protein